VKTREIALKIFEEGVRRSFFSPSVWKISDVLNERDRNLVRKIVYGSVRFLPYIDDTIEKLLKKPSKTPEKIKDILRLGIYEIEFLRIPSYATVNEYTNLTPKKFKGLVNAILREVSRTRTFDMKKNAALPNWLFEMLKKDLGKNFDIFLQSSISHTLSLRSVRMSRKELKEKLSPLRCTEMSYSKWGLKCSNGTNLKGELFEKGAFTFQDESSQMVAVAISPQAHEKILDACGGVGTKTSHIVQISPESETFYNDVNDDKRAVALSNFKRMKLMPKKILAFDLVKDDFDDMTFDKILLDAPCSALGTVGKHPDVLLRLKESDVKEKSRLQLEMMEKVWDKLKRGGTLVYSVCTVTKAETDDVIKSFVNFHDDAKVVDPFDGRYDFGFNGFGVQLLEYMEGFYISKIVKL